MAINIVWDFDNSLIDCNSDTFIIKELDADVYAEFKKLRGDWTELMNIGMKMLHRAGYREKDMVNAFMNTRVDQDILQLIRNYHQKGVKMYIASDANTFFIHTILEHLNLLECFEEIHTNPAKFDGELKIKPYHTNHDCGICRHNMCKSLIIASLPIDSPIVYVCDGHNDLCPLQSLTKNDWCVVRRNYKLHNIIEGKEDEYLVNIRYWSTGKELREIVDSISH